MKPAKSFPFERARRIRAKEVIAYRAAIRKKVGGPKRPSRGRPPKKQSERSQLVSLRLHPKILTWAKTEGRRRGLGYQTVITRTLLKLSDSA